MMELISLNIRLNENDRTASLIASLVVRVVGAFISASLLHVWIYMMIYVTFFRLMKIIVLKPHDNFYCTQPDQKNERTRTSFRQAINF
jgi:uncharacterized membrane protein YobD (UPF0266 family)